MVRLPDGWVLIPHVEGPKNIDDQLAVIVSVDNKELVICKHCKYRWDPIRCQMYSEGMKTPDDWYCADGEKENEHEDQEADDE
jgi:hypothetical protein